MSFNCYTVLQTEHLHYLLTAVFGISSQEIQAVSIGTDYFSIQFSTFEYREVLFDFENPELEETDFEALDSIFFEIVKNKRNDSALKNLFKTVFNEKIAYFKLAHFFVNEFYLGKPNKVDNHNRVISESVYRNIIKYLHYPMVDILIDSFRFQFLSILNNERTIYFTSDFDFINLWKYLGIFKTLWRFFKHIIAYRRLLLIEEFWSVILSQKFLRRNFMLNNLMFLFKTEIGETFKVKNIAFLLVHHSHKKFDFKNDFTIRPFKEYLFTNVGNVMFGLHPSYNTRYHPETLEKQVSTFEQAVFERPHYSRFHYLNCSYPDDLLSLEKSRISQDFSFYFCDKLLFRGSITRGFKLWSFTENRVINVEIVPLTIMDVTLSKTLKYSYEEAFSAATEKVRLSLLLGNTCVLLWHNNEMYEPLYKKNYQRKLLIALRNYLEELETIR